MEKKKYLKKIMTEMFQNEYQITIDLESSKNIKQDNDQNNLYLGIYSNCRQTDKTKIKILKESQG